MTEALRSATVRQTLVLLAVFLVAALASTGFVYLKLAGDLAGGLQADLISEAESFDLSATPPALMAIVGARARATDPQDTVIVYLRGDGAQVGNASVVREGNEVRIMPKDGEPPLSPDGYLNEVRQMPGGMLIIAQSLTPRRELADTFLTLFLLSFVPTAAVSLLVGAMLARRTARRVSKIEHTLERLSAGDLAARVDDPAGRDDLALISAGVNRMAERQQGATETLRQVTTDIAHDLKTPLQRASAHLQELQLRQEEGSDAALLTDAAAAEIDHAVQIFDAMLRIARIEGGDLASRFEPVDLCEIAQRIAELYLPTLEEEGDHLEVVLPGDPVIVPGDAGMIGQAVANLIENAHRHSPPRTRIVVSVGRGETGPVIEVADNGPGIPAAERDNVTRRFYRLERSRTTPGQGLGLSLVLAIATLHGGGLDLADNHPGTRAILRFRGAN